MKKSIKISTITAALLAVVNIQAANITPKQLDENSTYVNSVDDNLGNTYMVYQDGNEDDKRGQLLKYSDETWSVVAPYNENDTYFTGLTLQESDMAIDSENKLHILYIDYSSEYEEKTLSYQRYNPNSNLLHGWESQMASFGDGLDGSVSFTPLASDLALDINSSNVAISAYVDSDKKVHVRYLNDQGTIGSDKEENNFSDDTWDSLGDLTLTSSEIDMVVYKDVPYLAYKEEESRKVSVLKYLDNNWIVQAQNISDAEATDIKLSVQADDYLYLSYVENNSTVTKKLRMYESLSIAENNTSTITTITSDTASNLSYSLSEADADLFTISSEGALSFTTGADYEGKDDNNSDGIYEVGVNIKDNDTNLTSLLSFNITVTDVNDAPIITSEANLSAIEDSIYTYELNATDEDNNTLAWSVTEGTTLPSWLTLSTADFKVLGDSDFSDVTSDSFITFDNNGVPYVTYATDGIRVHKYNGTSWEEVGSKFGEAGYTEPKLVFHTDGTPYIIYSIMRGSPSVGVKKFSNGSWTDVGTTLDSSYTQNANIATDSSGNVYIIYQSQDSNYNYSLEIKMLTGSGTTWTSVTGLNATNNSSNGKLLVDGSDNLYAVYKDGTSGKAIVKKYAGQGWATVGTEGFSAGSVSYLDIAADSSNNLYVVYSDSNSEGKATVKKYNGTSWEDVGSAGFSDGSASYTSISIDSAGMPYVIYKDAGNNNKATVKKYNGTSWEDVGTAGFGDSIVRSTSIAVNSSDIPYIAYKDDTSSDTIVMSFENSDKIVLSGTPTNADVGTHDVNLTVSDGNLIDTQNFTITVANVNDAPTSSDITITMNEDGTNTFTLNDITFTDDDTIHNDSLDSMYITALPTTGTLTLNDANVTLNQKISASDISNLVFTPVADGFGDAYDTFKFVVTDGDVNTSAYTATLNVTNIPDAPVISSTAILTLNEDSKYTYDLNANDVDGDDLNWSVTEGTTLPSWLSLTGGVSAKEIYNLSQSEGTIVPQAVIDTKGNVFIIVAGNDGIDVKKIDKQGNVSNFANLDDYVYSKANPNYNPSDPISPQKIFQNQIMAIDSSDNIYLSSSYASSYDDNNIIYKITPDGVVSEYITDEIVSYMTIDSADTLYFTDNTANFYKVVKAPMWQKEKITITGDIQPETIGGLYTANNNLFVNSFGTILKLDSTDNSFSEFKTNVMIPTVNDVDNNGVIWGESFGELIPLIDLSNVDADLSNAALATKLGFAHTEDGTVTVYETSTVLSGTPTNDDVGTHSVNLTVSDGNLTDTQNFTITVVNVNDAPTSSAINSSQSIYINETIKPFANVVLNDIDNDTVSVALELTDNSYGTLSQTSIQTDTLANVQATLRNIVFTPNKNRIHLNDSEVVGITFIANDNSGGTTSGDVNLTLSNKLLDITQNEDGAGIIAIVDASEATQENPYTYTISSSNNSIAKAEIIDGKIVVSPVKDAYGTVSIELNATKDGVTTTETFEYTLNEVNDIPYVEDITDVFEEESESDRLKTHNFTISDDKAGITLSARSSNSEFISEVTVVENSDDTDATLSYTIPAKTSGFTKITITATDSQGAKYEEVFNVTVEASDATKCVANVQANLSFDDIKGSNITQNFINSNLVLPDTMDGASCGDGATLTWESSSDDVIKNDGTLGAIKDKTVLLTATITKDAKSDTKDFLLTVNKDTLTAEDAIKEILFENIKGSNEVKSEILFNLDLVETALGLNVNWTSTNSDVINPYSGYVKRGEVDENITITAIISDQSKEFNLTVLANESDDTTKLLKDKEWLTIDKLLDTNKDSNNIVTNLVKPLPYEGPNKSAITWVSSNEDAIATSGDVFRSGVRDTYVTLSATIGSDEEKKFLFKVLKTEVQVNNNTTFQEITLDDPQQVVVKFSENNEDVNTSANISNFDTAKTEKVISDNSVKTIFDIGTKVVEMFLNTDGTTQSQIENTDKNNNSVLSTIKVKTTQSKTDVSSDGSITTVVALDSNTSVQAELKTDGSVAHKVTTKDQNSADVHTQVVAKLPGSKVEVDESGNVETSSEILQDNLMVRVIAITDENGKTTTRFEKVNLTTGEVSAISSTLSEESSYPAGTSVEINEIDSRLFLETTTPLDNDLVIK